jgi:hypothetical protein
MEYALAKLEKKLTRKDVFIKNAKMRAERKVANMEKLVTQYRAALKTISEGSYPGYNGKPFGATPGITKGIIL